MYQAAVLSAHSLSSRQTRAREQDAANSPSLSDTFKDKWTDMAVFGKCGRWYLFQKSQVERKRKQEGAVLVSCFKPATFRFKFMACLGYIETSR